VRADLSLDEAGLREIARRTGGDYFRATDPAGLRRIFARIDEMEKTKVQVRTYARYSDLFPHFLAAAGVLLLLEAGAWLTRLRALP
jgi:Ca-activated chloride channel family protein